MPTPNKWTAIDNWKYVATGKVLDMNTNEEFEAQIRFTGTTAGVETSEVNGIRKAELHTELVKEDDSSNLGEMIILDGDK